MVAQLTYKNYHIVPTFKNIDHLAINGGAFTAGSAEAVADYLNNTLAEVTQSDIEFYKAKAKTDEASILKPKGGVPSTPFCPSCSSCRIAHQQNANAIGIGRVLPCF